MLRDPQVRRAIDRATQERSDRVEITQDSILRELAFLVFARPDYFLVDDTGAVTTVPGVPSGFLSAVAGVKKRTVRDFNGSVREETVRVMLWDKNKAISLAMRHLGILHDKLTVDVNVEFQRMTQEAANDYDREIARLAASKKHWRDLSVTSSTRKEKK